MKRIAVVQSNYIPWKGYFDLIGLVDEFILYDDVQFTRRDWRNRNQIKTPRGPRWLTIPVATKGRFTQTIAETSISDPRWAEKHWTALSQSYARASGFKFYRELFEGLYRGCRETRLSLINRRFIDGIMDALGIKTKVAWSSDYGPSGDATGRLVDLCRKTGATEYLSGPAAKAYLDEDAFRRAGIAVRWMDYDGYPEYRQLHPPFTHRVSVADLMLNEGPDAPRFMKCFRKKDEVTR